MISDKEILETIRMIELEGLDIRTVTMGINLFDCAGSNIRTLSKRIVKKISEASTEFVSLCNEIESELAIPIVNKRIAVSPIADVASSCGASDYVPVARALDEAAVRAGVDFIGGFGAQVHKGLSVSDIRLMDSIPRALAVTKRVCSFVNCASTRSGINMDAVRLMGKRIKELAKKTAGKNGIGCCKLSVFANAVEDNPFMAGAFHGAGEAERVINVGVSGPGVVRCALSRLDKKAGLGEVAELIKQTAFKITRAGELVGREISNRLGIEFGIVDLSLAPTTRIGDSIADILELMGLECTGAHGTTAALALLVDAVKKGGAMASSYVGGLSGAFIPVSEDTGMMNAVRAGSLDLNKLEAMTSVCSVGLDMIAVAGDTSAEAISGIIADELAIGVVNNKTTGVRIIPVPGKNEGDIVDWGGLLGSAPVMGVNAFACKDFIRRGGRIPAPINSLRN